MRLFIAIPIPEEIKIYITSLQDYFKSDDFHKFPLRFVKREQMHLTIDFLGETPNDAVEGIIKKLEKIRSEQFDIKLTNLGTFPTKEDIRVIWIGVEKNDLFIDLQKNVRKIFNHRGKLMPHLTIARSKELIREESISEMVKIFRIDPLKFHIDKFILFKSEPSENGQEHIIIKEFAI